MVHWYLTTYNYYIDGKCIYSRCTNCLSDTELKDEVLDINWHNLTEIYHKYGLVFPGNVWNRKRGKILSFWNSDCELFSKDFIHDIKEWKHSLNMQLVISNKIADNRHNINDVLEYYNSELAIKYLAERGLNIFKESN